MLSPIFGLAMLVGLAFGLAVLFLPTLVARARRHPNAFAIFLVNLFFGWSFVGWIVALIWACTRPARPVLYVPAFPTLRHYPAVSTSRALRLARPASQGSR